MSADVAQQLSQSEARAEPTPWRPRVLVALGPLTALAGVAWALVQPYRLTLLHPHGQGFWWLLAEPPLYVVLVGVLFRFLLVPGLVADYLAAQNEERPE